MSFPVFGRLWFILVVPRLYCCLLDYCRFIVIVTSTECGFRNCCRFHEVILNIGCRSDVIVVSHRCWRILMTIRRLFPFTDVLSAWMLCLCVCVYKWIIYKLWNLDEFIRLQIQNKRLHAILSFKNIHSPVIVSFSSGQVQSFHYIYVYKNKKYKNEIKMN